MKKRLRFFACLVLLVLLGGTLVAFAADDNPIISEGQVHESDFIAAGSTVTNNGAIKGDMIVGAQTVSMRGTVEGDVIAAAMSDIDLSGDVLGSVRVASANNINIASNIQRNLMLYGSTVIVNENAVIGRNAYLSGGTIKSLGTVKGDTDITGSVVTLGGTYEGNVTVHNMTEGSILEIKPGTVITGKLTYKGVTDYNLPSEVRIGSYEYVKIDPVSMQAYSAFNLMAVVRTVVTMFVYYLFALLLYKFFPRFFVRSGDFLSNKMLSAAGIGVATLGTFVGAVLLMILVFLLTIFIFKFSIFGFTSLFLIFFAVVTFVFAALPVSLWLGNKVTKGSGTVAAKLAIGLSLITALKLALDLLQMVPQVGSVFGIINFLFNAAIWLVGTGAVLKTVFDMIKSANCQAEMEENELNDLVDPTNG